MLWKKLKRDLTPEPLVSREIDFAHPAHTEQRFNPVVTDQLTDQIARRLVNQQFGGDCEGRRLDKITRSLMRLDHRLNLFAQALVAVAFFAKKRGALFRRTRDGCMIDVSDSTPAPRFHYSSPLSAP